MKTLNTDLFPETLLVSFVDGQPMTDSLKIAAHFGKQHRDVLRTIRGIIERTKNPERLRNFTQSFGTFESSNGAKSKRPIYLLTRKGFSFVATGFTGAEADEWKWQFLDAFDDMERLLLSQTQREAEVLYNLKPRWKPVVKNPNLSRLQLIAMTGHKSAGSITACRKSMKKNGLID